MHIDYKSPLVREIRDRQRDVASREQLLARIDAAERLIASVDVDETYRTDQVFEYLEPEDRSGLAAAGRKIPGARPSCVSEHDLRSPAWRSRAKPQERARRDQAPERLSARGGSRVPLAGRVPRDAPQRAP